METKTSIDYDRTFEELCNTYRSADKDKAITAHRSETIQFLTAHIDIDIQRKIDSLQNPNRCILLVGKDENLAKGIVSYIYLTKGMKFFEAVNCSGIDDETMRRRFLGNGQSLSFLPVKLYIEEMQSSEEPPFSITIKKRDSLLENNVFHWFCLGHTLFLWNLDLNGKDHSLVKPLAMKIDDICKCKEHGMLIVSTATEDLPEYFVRQFEKIDLRHGEKDRLQTGCLIFNDKEARLQERQIKLWKAVQTHTRVEKILNDVFVSCNYKIDAKINPYDRNNFDKTISAFNRLCKKKFRIKDKIIENCEFKTYGINEKYTGKINLT